jgi:two-component system response regulator DesR
MIRILLAQRGALLRSALASVLDSEPDLQVVAEQSDGTDLIAVAERVRPDVALIDGDLPGPDVRWLAARLAFTVPGTHPLILTSHDLGDAPVGQDLGAPSVGQVSTQISPPELIAVVRGVVAGEPVADTALFSAPLPRANPLTSREREVLRVATQGMPVASIASRLHLSPGTVRNYLSRIIAKTGARTRIEAIRVAQERGWLEPPASSDDHGGPRMTLSTALVLRAFLAHPMCYGHEIASRTGLPSGTVYPILARLEALGWVVSWWEDADPQDQGRPRRRYYRLAAGGLTRAMQALAAAGARSPAAGVLLDGGSR